MTKGERWKVLGTRKDIHINMAFGGHIDLFVGVQFNINYIVYNICFLGGDGSKTMLPMLKHAQV